MSRTMKCGVAARIHSANAAACSRSSSSRANAIAASITPRATAHSSIRAPFSARRELAEVGAPKPGGEFENGTSGPASGGVDQSGGVLTHRQDSFWMKACSP
jgi:hypothetical protein